MKQRMTRSGLMAAGRALLPAEPQLGVALIRTVIAVETRGSGYDAKGRLAMLYEPHIAWKQSSGETREELVREGLAYEKWRRGYPKDSYPRFHAAEAIDEEIAHRAASWGLPQILGANFRAAGYGSAREMVAAFRAGGADEQISAMARFIRANPRMHDALRRRDWAGFAERYNGPGYKLNQYDTKLANAFKRFEIDPWAGLGDEPAVASTIEDQRRDKQQAAAVIAATTGTGATGAGTMVATDPPPAPAQAGGMDWVAVAGLILFAALTAGAIAAAIKFNRSAPREPVIEEGAQ